MNEISNDLKCMTFSKNDISKIENESYNQALEEFYNGLADELLWIRERFGDDAYMEARCSVGCLQNRLAK